MSTPKKRIMRSFRIDEISCVDSPANRHATMRIMKRVDDEGERRPARLRNIKLSELSLVDKGACAGARVTLFKRDAEEEPDMHFHKIGGDSIAAFSSLDEAVAHIKKVERVPHHQAMAKAASRFPALLDAYQTEGVAIAKAAADAARPHPIAKAVRDFDALVDGIAERDRCPRYEAMEEARREHPTEFEAYQEA